MSYSALDSLDMGTRVLETKDCIKGWGGRWKLEGPFCPALVFRPFPGAMASVLGICHLDVQPATSLVSCPSDANKI